jgi:hypothetical protein
MRGPPEILPSLPGPRTERNAGEEADVETEEEIIARALAEASLDGVSSTPAAATEDEGLSLAFPTLPKHQPELQGEDEATQR